MHVDVAKERMLMLQEMHVDVAKKYMLMLLWSTAYCMWSVIKSQSPISISLVSFQRNVAKET